MAGDQQRSCAAYLEETLMNNRDRTLIRVAIGFMLFLFFALVVAEVLSGR